MNLEDIAKEWAAQLNYYDDWLAANVGNLTSEEWQECYKIMQKFRQHSRTAKSDLSKSLTENVHKQLSLYR